MACLTRLRCSLFAWFEGKLPNLFQKRGPFVMPTTPIKVFLKCQAKISLYPINGYRTDINRSSCPCPKQLDSQGFSTLVQWPKSVVLQVLSPRNQTGQDASCGKPSPLVWIRFFSLEPSIKHHIKSCSSMLSIVVLLAVISWIHVICLVV